MSIPDNHTVVSVVVPIETRNRLHEIAKGRGTSVTRMLSAWLASGIDAPLERVAKWQSVRRDKDELMVSLPRDWQRRAGVAAGDRVTLSYSNDALIIRAE
jgi:hypothetical protein